MSLQSLSVFIAVAEEENFTAAARRLNLTQPTVSFHMDNLEKNLGCLLFNRTSKGVTLTPYGKRLYESASIVDKTLKTTYSEIRRMAEGYAGHISLGASTIPGEYILPGLISSFLNQNDAIRFTLATSNSKHILDSFLAGKFAIAIVGIKPDDREAVEMWHDELVLVGHPDLSANFTEHKGCNLDKFPMVFRAEPSGSRKTIMDALEKLGIHNDKLKVVLEVTENQSLKSAIINKAGIGFISKWAVKDEIAAGKLAIVEIPDLCIKRTFYLISNPLLETAGIRRFIDYLLKEQVD